MAQALTWYGGKAYEYVDGALQEVKTPQTYTMPDGTPYTYNSDGIAQALPQGQTTAAPTYQGSAQGIPQWLIDANKGQSISSGDDLALGGNTSWNIGNQVYSGTQWGGEPGASPTGSDMGSTFYNYQNTPAMESAQQTGKLSQLNGSPYNTLDANGNLTGSGTWSNIHDSNKNTTDGIVTAIVGAILGGAGAFGGAGGATGLTAAGGEAAGYGATAIPAGAAGYGGAAAGAAGGLGAAAGTTGGTGAGVTGFGDAGTMYGGASAGDAATLGGGASVNGGAALGTTAATGAAGAGSSGVTSTAGTPPPANPYTAATSGGIGGLSNTQILGALTSILGGGSGGGGSGGTGAGGAGTNTGGLDLNSILGLIGGGVDASRQGQAATAMKSWLDSQNAAMTNYMNPNSPEYNAMWEQMSRKDAAAGRNSQYGPRTSDFLANVAKAKADNTLRFTAGTSKAYSDALTMNANKYAGLSAALQRAATANGGQLSMNSIVNALRSYNGGDLGTGSGSTGTDNQSILNTINNQGGAPIDYGSDATDESAVWDSIINGWGF